MLLSEHFIRLGGSRKMTIIIVNTLLSFHDKWATSFKLDLNTVCLKNVTLNHLTGTWIKIIPCSSSGKTQDSSSNPVFSCRLFCHCQFVGCEGHLRGDEETGFLYLIKVSRQICFLFVFYTCFGIRLKDLENKTVREHVLQLMETKIQMLLERILK